MKQKLLHLWFNLRQQQETDGSVSCLLAGFVSSSGPGLNATLHYQLQKARARVLLPAEEQLLGLPKHQLGRGEDVQITQQVAPYHCSMAVRQADVKVRLRIQGPHQGHNLKAATEVEHLEGVGSQGDRINTQDQNFDPFWQHVQLLNNLLVN